MAAKINWHYMEQNYVAVTLCIIGIQHKLHMARLEIRMRILQ